MASLDKRDEPRVAVASCSALGRRDVEDPFRVAVGDFLEVRLGQRSAVHECHRSLGILIGIIDREHDVVRAEDLVAVLEGGVKIHAAGRNHEIVLHVLARLALRNTQAISQGDPSTAGHLLATRSLTIEELKSRQVTFRSRQNGSIVE